MSISISNLGVQASLTSALQAEQTTLTQLSSQLSSQRQHTDLTDYSPSDARSLINLQSTATQRQAYVSVINSVSTQLSIYDTTMTDIESVVSQAQNLAQNNPNYSTSNAQNIANLASNYLTSVGVDLNQQVNGQYIFAGSRYTTAPVADLATLSTSTLSSTIYTDGASLPSYDAGYSASSLTATVSGQDVTIRGSVTLPQNVSMTVNGTTYTYQLQSTDTTTADAAAGLEALVAAAIPGTSVSGSTITVGGSGSVSAAASNVTDTDAYATDSANVDTGYSVNYGVSSDNPAFQQIIAGLRYLQKAGNDTDATTYASDIQEATNLLTAGAAAEKTLHTNVAYNQNTMTTELTAQQAALSQLTNQVSDIQQVDVTQVSTEITALQTILQASYLVTGDIEKLSIVSYL